VKVERLDQIEEIYHAALEAPADKCDLLIEESCGEDEDLRREVESLLSFGDTPTRFVVRQPALKSARLFQRAFYVFLHRKIRKHT
jgi:hypothetical protein